MAFDINKVLQVASSVVQDTSDSDRVRTLYPGNGCLQVRLLANPATGGFSRDLFTHKLADGKKLVCARQYKQSCPMCNAVDEIKTITGKDMWQSRSSHRVIMWAQYVNSSKDYDWGGYKAPQTGDTILLMVPWSAYSQICSIISNAGEAATKILVDNVGKVLSLYRKQDKTGRIEYRVEIDAFTGDFTSKSSQAEFDAFLDALPSLNIQGNIPEIPDADFITKLQIEADDLKSRVLGGVYANGSSVNVPEMPNNPAMQVPNQQPMANPAPVMSAPAMNNPAPVQQTVPGMINPDVAPWDPTPNTAPQVAPQMQNPVAQPQASVAPAVDPNSVGANGKPPCFGNLNIQDQKCLLCDHTIDCDNASKK